MSYYFFFLYLQLPFSNFIFSVFVHSSMSFSSQLRVSSNFIIRKIHFLINCHNYLFYANFSVKQIKQKRRTKLFHGVRVSILFMWMCECVYNMHLYESVHVHVCMCLAIFSSTTFFVISLFLRFFFFVPSII